MVPMEADLFEGTLCVRKYPEKLAKNEVDVLEKWMIES